MAIRPDGKAIYALNSQTSDVTVIDGITGEIIEKVPAGGFAVHFMPAASVALVPAASTVHAVDLATHLKQADVITDATGQLRQLGAVARRPHRGDPRPRRRPHRRCLERQAGGHDEGRSAVWPGRDRLGHRPLTARGGRGSAPVSRGARQRDMESSAAPAGNTHNVAFGARRRRAPRAPPSPTSLHRLELRCPDLILLESVSLHHHTGLRWIWACTCTCHWSGTVCGPGASIIASSASGLAATRAPRIRPVVREPVTALRGADDRSAGPDDGAPPPNALHRLVEVLVERESRVGGDDHVKRRGDRRHGQPAPPAGRSVLGERSPAKTPRIRCSRSSTTSRAKSTPVMRVDLARRRRGPGCPR